MQRSAGFGVVGGPGKLHYLLQRKSWFGVAGLLVVLMALPAGAHEWYPVECCGGRDCTPLPATQVRIEPSGYHILITDEVVPFSQAKWSQDGRFHRCRVRFADPLSRTRCLFVPPPAM